MPDTTAKVRSKGLDQTGFTEKDAEHAYRNKGARRIALVELRSVQTHEDAEGKRGVDLVIDGLYPVPLEKGETLDEHLRGIMQTLDYNQRLADGDAPTIEGTEPATIGTLIDQGVAFVSPAAADDALDLTGKD